MVFYTYSRMSDKNLNTVQYITGLRSQAFAAVGQIESQVNTLAAQLEQAKANLAANRGAVMFADQLLQQLAPDTASLPSEAPAPTDSPVS